MTPDWRDLEAPLTIFVTTHYKVLPSFQFVPAVTLTAQFRWELFSPHFTTSFSALNVHTTLPSARETLQPELKAPSAHLLREKGKLPQPLKHTQSRYGQFYPLVHSKETWRKPASSTCPTSCTLQLCSSAPHTPIARTHNWCLKQAKQSHYILPKFLQRAVYSYLYNKHHTLFPNIFNLCIKDFEVSFKYRLFWFNLWHVLALAVNPVFHDKLPSKVLGCAWLRMNVVFLRGWPACCFLYFPVSILPSFRGFLCDLPAFHWFHYHKNLLCHQ